MLWRLKKRRDTEIAPDEIFLDSESSEFDRARFEGTIEQPLSRSTFLGIGGVLGLIFLVLAVRTGHLELINGATYAAESANNSLEVKILFAPRGAISDMHGRVLAENIANEDGTMSRKYPLSAMGQIIGYVSYPKKDSKGIYYEEVEKGMAGLEAEYDEVLRGENGKLLSETDALGRVRSEGLMVPAKPGQPLKLSIDAELEESLARAIADIAREKNFIAGAGVIMDIYSGAVRALVSYPSYDPNIMSDGQPREVIARYNHDAGRPFLDHAVQGVYAPGSIVKPLIAAGALTDGLITEQTTVDDQGFISLPDPYHPGKKFIYRSWKKLGTIDVVGAIAWSSDIFFYTIGGGFGNQKGLGIDRLEYWYKQFGLGSATGINLPEEADGLIPNPDWKRVTFDEPWYLGDTYFTSIGQYSMQVTPLQMARATAAIANGGKLVKPTLLADQPSEFSAIPVSPESLEIVKRGMRKTVTEALAGQLFLPYVKVAAKTGTAETGSRNQYDNSWVEGFFPYDNPRYSFAVVLERGPAGTGSQAVNAMRRFFDTLYASGSSYFGAAD